MARAFGALLAVCVSGALGVQNHGLPFWSAIKNLFHHGGDSASDSSADGTAATALGPCSTDKECFGLGEDLRCCPVGDDVTAPGGCPSTVKVPALTAEHVSVCQLPSHKFNIQKAVCGCVKPTNVSCVDGPATNWPYRHVMKGFKQWLIIGDSVSEGISRHVRINGTALRKFKIQMIHIPVNGLNSRFGKRCLADWLDNPARWDLISFNFGLHDMAHNTERLEPKEYGRTLKNITMELKNMAPQAKLLFATTTPAAEECGPTSNCGYAQELHLDRLPRDLLSKVSALNDTVVHTMRDPSLYNQAARKALATLPFQVPILDLYRRVTDQCGLKFETCPLNCDSKGKNFINSECYIFPGDVHFTRTGYLDLASAYTDAVVAELGLLQPPPSHSMVLQGGRKHKHLHHSHHSHKHGHKHGR